MAVRPRPNILWRLFVIIGVGSMTALTLSDDAWAAWEENVGDVVPRATIRNLLVGTLGLHALEGVLVTRSAARSGQDHPGRWGLSAFFWGFPVIFRLRRANGSAEMVFDEA
jgi:hypothetical protein